MRRHRHDRGVAGAIDRATTEVEWQVRRAARADAGGAAADPAPCGFEYPLDDRLIGGLCLILAIVLVLPIPFGNMLPAFAMCLIAPDVVERDGVWIIGGTVTAVAALLIVYGVVYALSKAALFLIVNAF